MNRHHARFHVASAGEPTPGLNFVAWKTMNRDALLAKSVAFALIYPVDFLRVWRYPPDLHSSRVEGLYFLDHWRCLRNTFFGLDFCPIREHSYAFVVVRGDLDHVVLPGDQISNQVVSLRLESVSRRSSG